MSELSNQSTGSAVEQRGIVERVDGNRVFVRIYQNSACDGCSVSGGCSALRLGGNPGKLVEADCSQHMEAGEAVKLYMSQRDGLLSVLLSFVLPLVLIFVFVFSFKSLSISEEMLAIGALAVAGFYYLVLRLFAPALKARIRFSAVRAETCSTAD